MSTARTINPGRNLPLATVVGLGLLALLVGSLVFNPFLFATLLALAGIGAVKELIAFFPDSRVSRFGLMIAVATVIVVAYLHGVQAASLLAVAGVFANLILRLNSGTARYASDAGIIALAVVYIGLGLAFAADLSRYDNGLQLVMTLVLLTAANDTGGYFAGIIAGKHPMVPSISPKKSWEGFAGSLFLQAVIGAFAVPAMLEISMFEGMALGILMTFTATAGDLIESALKRDRGIKDSGNTIPGHGGVLDRIDSHLLNAPVAWLALTFLTGL